MVYSREGCCCKKRRHDCGPICVTNDVYVPPAAIPLCKDPNFEPIPDSNPPSALASFFNECCDMFVDENNDPIIITIDGISAMPPGNCTN